MSSCEGRYDTNVKDLKSVQNKIASSYRTKNAMRETSEANWCAKSRAASGRD